MSGILNPSYALLEGGYLFPEINRRTEAFRELNPGVKVMKLGIGNTTEPIAQVVADSIHASADRLVSREGYSGYGDEVGDPELREAIARDYDLKGVSVDPENIFVSDGAKCDAGNVQEIFGKVVVAVQDPAYPVYVDSQVMGGRTGAFDHERGRYRGVEYMACTPENGFFPSKFPANAKLIYLCSPNNPTGAVATHEQLQRAVDHTNASGAVLVFDAAYAEYIRDQSLPKSIYEIPGAEDCAIEVNSLSKSAGFTGIRLSWMVVPPRVAAEGEEASARQYWNRRHCTKFNAASNISQWAGIAALSEEGKRQNGVVLDGYMANAGRIRAVIEEKGLRAWGGDNSPYVYFEAPGRMDSWDCFNKLLGEAHVVSTPGSGFGPAGQGFMRLSGFGHTEDNKEAVQSIRHNFRV